MFALLLTLACSSSPPTTWTPLPPPLPYSPGGFEELVLVMESLPRPGDPAAKDMAEQVKDGVVPTDVELSHRDLGVLLALDGIHAPVPALDDDFIPWMGLRVLGDAAILESRVHLAYGEGLYAWGALAPVLEIAGDLQAAGGGLMPFSIGANLERSVLLELERVVASPYGLGREGEAALKRYLLARQAGPALAPYAVSTECEAILAILEEPALHRVEWVFYDLEATLDLQSKQCELELAMMAKPYGERVMVEQDWPSPLIWNRIGIDLLIVLGTRMGNMGQVEGELQLQRAMLLTALELRQGHRGAWPTFAMPTDPTTAKPLQWDGSTLKGGAGIKELEYSLTPAPPVWSAVEP